MADSEIENITVMVVDDSRLMRVAARKILKNDFTIVEAADGEEAWETLQQHPEIALVMSDLSMPNLDGLGLLKRIRESDFRELPVIIITGAEDDDGSKTNALSAGANDFITKPFESIQLLARVKSQAHQKDTREALQQSEAETQQLRDISQVDSLTGLANKRAFISHVEENLAYATRHQTEVSLILVRIEKYKVLFLRRGKQVAEILDKELAKILSEGRRREDTVGHIALDTFGVLLPSANKSGAKRVLTQLADAIDRADINVEGKPVPFKVNFGLCTPEIQHGICADDVMAFAEIALSTPPALETPIPSLDSATEIPQPIETVEAPVPHTPIAEPAIPEVATPTDIRQALEALTSNVAPATAPDALVRGILPLLSAWNCAHGQQYDSLMKLLHEALDTSEKPDAESTPSRQSPQLVS